MSYRNTNHSVNFINSNVCFDLIFPPNFLTSIFTESLGDNFIFESGFSDLSSNASATLEVPLENFQEIFQVKLNTNDTEFQNFQFFIDHTKWNFNHISQSKLLFSEAIVDFYDGSLNRGPIHPSHPNQSLKRDMTRHVFQYVPNAEKLNNLQQFQNNIVKMIENMDSLFHDKIIEKLKVFSDLGFQNFQDTSMNPLKVLVGSSINEDNLAGYDLSDEMIRNQTTSPFLDKVKQEIETHNYNISQYAYYVDSSYGTTNSQMKYYGPLFLNIDNALTTAYALQRFVNFQEETVDGLSLILVQFEDYPTYTFYALPGYTYDKGTYKVYDTYDEMIPNVQSIVDLNLWKGNFVDYINIIVPYTFQDGDQISILLEYVPDSLNVNMFDHTFTNIGNNLIEKRSYQIFLKMKQTKIIQTVLLTFQNVLLSILQNEKYEAKTVIDIVRIRIELEIKIYHKNVNMLASSEKMIIDELKNSVSLPYIFLAIQNWQYWYRNWYIIGNPIHERQVVQTNINSAKTELSNIGQTSNIIDFLLTHIS